MDTGPPFFFFFFFFPVFFFFFFFFFFALAGELFQERQSGGVEILFSPSGVTILSGIVDFMEESLKRSEFTVVHQCTILFLFPLAVSLFLS